MRRRVGNYRKQLGWSSIVFWNVCIQDFRTKPFVNFCSGGCNAVSINHGFFSDILLISFYEFFEGMGCAVMKDSARSSDQYNPFLLN